MILNPYAYGQSKPVQWIGTSTGDTGFGNYSLTIPSATLGGSGSKIVWFMVAWRGAYGTTQMSSLTAAGASGTRLRRVTTSSSARNLEAWYASTTAETGDIVMAFSQHSVTCRVGVFWSNRVPPTANSDTSYSASASSRNATVSTYAGGYVLAASMWFDSGKSTTWTNATELEDSTGLESFAWVDETPTAASRTVTATLNSASAAFHHLVVAAS